MEKTWKRKKLPFQPVKNRQLKKEDGGQDMLKGCQKPDRLNRLKSVRPANSDTLRRTVPAAPARIHLNRRYFQPSCIPLDYTAFSHGHMQKLRKEHTNDRTR